MKKLFKLIKRCKSPIGLAMGAITLLKFLGLRRVLMLGLGASLGYYLGAKKAKDR